jgi:hypothetical protein
VSWARLDDSIYDHPRIARCSMPAAALFMFAITYASRHGTDGRIPVEVVERLARGDVTLAPELLSLGLFILGTDGTIEVRNFLAYNPSAREVAKRRKQQRLRVKKHRASRDEFSESGNAKSNALLRAGIKKSISLLGKRGAGGKGKLPDDVTLDDEGAAYATANGCRQPERLFESFALHYRSNGKLMANWWLTWQRWVREAHGGPDWKACACQRGTVRRGSLAALDNVQRILEET